MLHPYFDHRSDYLHGIVLGQTISEEHKAIGLTKMLATVSCDDSY